MIVQFVFAEFSTKWKAEAHTWNLTGRYPRPIQRDRNLKGLHSSNRRCSNPNNNVNNNNNNHSNNKRSNSSSSSSNNNNNNNQAAFHRRPKTSISNNCLPAIVTPALRIKRIYGTTQPGSDHHRTMPSRFN